MNLFVIHSFTQRCNKKQKCIFFILAYDSKIHLCTEIQNNCLSFKLIFYFLLLLQFVVNYIFFFKVFIFLNLPYVRLPVYLFVCLCVFFPVCLIPYSSYGPSVLILSRTWIRYDIYGILIQSWGEKIWIRPFEINRINPSKKTRLRCRPYRKDRRRIRPFIEKNPNSIKNRIRPFFYVDRY